jgi:hypothetical protein
VKKLTPDDEQWWEEHGISLDVRDARPYQRYTVANREPVRDEYRSLPQSWQKGFMTRVCTDGISKDGVEEKCAGLLIMRHPPRGLDLPPIYAELRPDADNVKTGQKKWHYHADPPQDKDPVHPETDKPLSKSLIYSADVMRQNRHIDRRKSHDDHKGDNDPGVHSHQPMGKYIFPPKPKKDARWYHDHDDVRRPRELKRDPFGKPRPMNPERRVKHVEHDHAGLDVVGKHPHISRVSDDGVNYAARVDVHPLAYRRFGERFEKATRVFFVIEGCLKSDSMLSAGEAVFSVPSVTLWGTPYDDLEKVAASLLQGQRVVVVADADWYAKHEVLTQAILCRSFLRKLGISTLVSAPPINSGHKGWDDFRGKGGGEPDDLVVMDRELSPRIDSWAAQQPSTNKKDRDKIDRNVGVLKALALHAGTRRRGRDDDEDDGVLYRSTRSFARILDIHEDTVDSALEDLAHSGAIEIAGSLETRDEAWYGRRMIYGFDWADRPTIKIREDLRAGPMQFERLGDAEAWWKTALDHAPVGLGYSARARRVREIVSEGSLRTGDVGKLAQELNLSPEYLRDLDSAARTERFKPFEEGAALNILLMYAQGMTVKEITAEFDPRSERWAQKILARWREQLEPSDRLYPHPRNSRRAA